MAPGIIEQWYYYLGVGDILKKMGMFWATVGSIVCDRAECFVISKKTFCKSVTNMIS